MVTQPDVQHHLADIETSPVHIVRAHSYSDSADSALIHAELFDQHIPHGAGSGQMHVGATFIAFIRQFAAVLIKVDQGRIGCLIRWCSDELPKWIHKENPMPLPRPLYLISVQNAGLFGA